MLTCGKVGQPPLIVRVVSRWRENDAHTKRRRVRRVKRKRKIKSARTAHTAEPLAPQNVA